MTPHKITINGQVFEFQSGRHGLVMSTRAGGITFATVIENLAEQNLNAIAIREFQRLRPLVNSNMEVSHEVAS